MASEYTKRNTIIAYLDLVIQISAIEGAIPTEVVMLNRVEWMQLVNLMTLKYNNCQTDITIADGEVCGTYKTLRIMYDGSDTNHTEYHDNIYALERVADRAHQQTGAGSASYTETSLPPGWVQTSAAAVTIANQAVRHVSPLNTPPTPVQVTPFNDINFQDTS